MARGTKAKAAPRDEIDCRVNPGRPACPKNVKLWWLGRPMTKQEIDWPGCPLVEIKLGVQSGAPVLHGTRLPVSAIVDNFRLWPERAGNSGTVRSSARSRRGDFGLRQESPRCASCLIRMFRLVCAASWPGTSVRTLVEMRWPDQLENGELLELVPASPGRHSQGETVCELERNIREAIAGVLEGRACYAYQQPFKRG